MNRPSPLPVSPAAAFVPAGTLKASAHEFSPTIRKEFYGAIVEFGPGAAVISVKLPTECSILQVRPHTPLFSTWFRHPY